MTSHLLALVEADANSSVADADFSVVENFAACLVADASPNTVAADVADAADATRVVSATHLIAAVAAMAMRSLAVMAADTAA